MSTKEFKTEKTKRVLTEEEKLKKREINKAKLFFYRQKSQTSNNKIVLANSRAFINTKYERRKMNFEEHQESFDRRRT